MKNKHLPASLKQLVFASMWIAICLLATCGAVQETSPVAAQTEPSVIWNVAWSPDGTQVAVGDLEGVRLYTSDFRQSRLLELGVRFAFGLAWSPDGARLAYGGEGGKVEVIDTPLPDNEPSTARAQDADQYYYAYVYQVPVGGPIVIKAVNPNAPTDSMLLYSTNLLDHAPLESALASPDGRWIAVIPRSRGEYLRLIEVATGQMLDVSYHGIPFDFSDGSLLGQFESIVWSPNSQLLAFTSFTSDGTVDVFVYNLADGTLTNLSQDAASQYTLAWSPDSAYLASGGVACDGDECDAQIDIFEWATRSHVVSQHPAWGTYPAIKTMPCQLRWSLESRYLNFVASCDGTIPALEKELFLLDRIQGRVSRLTNYTQTAYQPPEAPVEYPVRLAWYDSVWYDTHTILLGATYGQEVPGDYVIRSQIIEYDLLNDSQTILRSDMTAEEWTPSPVQNLFAFRTASGYSPRTRHGVEIANVAAGVLTTIGSGPAGCDLAWSPDGATLAYTGRGQPMRSCYYSYYSADTLYFMDSLTGQLAQYTPVEMEPVQAVGWVALTAFNATPTANAGPDQIVTVSNEEFARECFALNPFKALGLLELPVSFSFQ
jgi:Tol biopolymer transport system component